MPIIKNKQNYLYMKYIVVFAMTAFFCSKIYADFTIEYKTKPLPENYSGCYKEDGVHIASVIHATKKDPYQLIDEESEEGQEMKRYSIYYANVPVVVKDCRIVEIRFYEGRWIRRQIEQTEINRINNLGAVVVSLKNSYMYYSILFGEWREPKRD